MVSIEKKGSKIHVFLINNPKENDKKKEDALSNTKDNNISKENKGDKNEKNINNNEEIVKGDEKDSNEHKSNERVEEIITHKIYHPQVKIVKVSCGKRIIGFLSASGKIYCWHLNELNDFDKNVPYLLVDNIIKHKFIHDVSCGENHIAFLSKEGELFTYGDNTYAQLGISYNSNNNNNNNIDHNNNNNIDHNNNNNIDNNNNNNIDNNNNNNIDHNNNNNIDHNNNNICCNDDGILDLNTFNKLYNNNNNNNKLKNYKKYKVHKVNTQNNIVKCAYASDKFTLFLTIEGILYGVGLINEHLLKGDMNKDKINKILTKPHVINTNNISFKKISIGHNFILGVDMHNDVYSWGKNEKGRVRTY